MFQICLVKNDRRRDRSYWWVNSKTPLPPDEYSRLTPSPRASPTLTRNALHAVVAAVGRSNRESTVTNPCQRRCNRRVIEAGSVESVLIGDIVRRSAARHEIQMRAAIAASIAHRRADQLLSSCSHS